MTIQDLIKKKIKAIDVFLKLSADQLRDTRNLTIHEEYQLVNRRYKALKSKRKLENELNFICNDMLEQIFN